MTDKWKSEKQIFIFTYSTVFNCAMVKQEFDVPGCIKSLHSLCKIFMKQI
jgi:hypothetical protein